MGTGGAVVHALALPGGGLLRPLGEPDLRIAARVEGEPASSEAAAWAEAIPHRRPVVWATPFVLPSDRELERFSYDRGASSVDVLRDDPSLVTCLQAGTWFSARWH